MRKILFIILITSMYSCKSGPVSFVVLRQFDTLDSVMADNEMVTMKHFSVIVNNYRKDDAVLKSIDSCATAIAGDKPSKYSHLKIIFYKSSDITNEAHLKENPRDIDRYSQDNDMILVYNWENGKFMGAKHLQ